MVPTMLVVDGVTEPTRPSGESQAAVSTDGLAQVAGGVREQGGHDGDIADAERVAHGPSVLAAVDRAGARSRWRCGCGDGAGKHARRRPADCVSATLST